MSNRWEVFQLLEEVVRQGITHFDTARSYGRGSSEKLLGVEDYKASFELYLRLVQQETREVRNRGVRVMVAHHADPKQNEIGAMFAKLKNEQGVEVVAMDMKLGDFSANNPNFLPCQHWNEEGYKVVAEILESQVLSQ